MNKFVFAALLFLSACQSGQKSYSKAENAFDAGREFMDAKLKGDFNKAAFYMLPDTVNQQLLAAEERDYRSKDRSDRQLLRTASINILEVQDLDSNQTLIRYQYSFDKNGKTLKVIRQQQNWLVDLKSSFK